MWVIIGIIIIGVVLAVAEQVRSDAEIKEKRKEEKYQAKKQRKAELHHLALQRQQQGVLSKTQILLAILIILTISALTFLFILNI